jgi:hypothetical protein
MEIQRTGNVLPGYHRDIFSDDIFNSPTFNNLCVYTLPGHLIDLIQEQQPGLFSADQIRKELEFAKHPMTVVFDRTEAKTASLLQKFVGSIDETQYTEMFGAGAYEAVAKVIDGDLRKVDLIGKAYCGWLVQQDDYQRDIDDLQSLLAAQADAAEIRKQICQKWRLSSLVTTEIPNPLLPHLSAINFYSKEVPEGAVVPFIPDTFPIPGTGFVVDQLNNSRKNSGATHLSDWWNLTANSVGNTRPFEILARKYQLQHYWRVLRTRFPDQTNRKQKVFSGIFAAYFEVSQDTIRRDFQQLRRKSGLLDRPIELRF